MAKSPDQIVADIDRQQNEEDRDLIPRAGRTIAGMAGKAKDYIADKIKSMDQRTLQEVTTDKMDQRSLEDVFKGKPPVYKQPVKKAKGGTVSSASKRADGCAIKGKTRGKMV
jgi:hypothetical protein